MKPNTTLLILDQVLIDLRSIEALAWATAVAPGYIETSINDGADAVAFLCMPASNYATGTVVAVDGGFLAG
jgi:enoyl-[acyl-carrier-protein] reductase (NADH)